MEMQQVGLCTVIHWTWNFFAFPVLPYVLKFTLNHVTQHLQSSAEGRAGHLSGSKR